VEDPVVLEVQGGLLTLLDPRSMTAVLGHEIGHYLAHGPWTPMGRTELLTGALIPMEGVRGDPLRRERAQIARELTADRFGVLACRDLKAALRLEMIATTGVPGSALRRSPSAESWSPAGAHRGFLRRAA
jgi:Zn-dependent protease with chaperone function